MKVIRKALEGGLDLEIAKIMSNPKFNYRQLERVVKGLKLGLNTNQVKIYVNPKYDYELMEKAIKALLVGIPTTEVKDALENVKIFDIIIQKKLADKIKLIL